MVGYQSDKRKRKQGNSEKDGNVQKRSRRYSCNLCKLTFSDERSRAAHNVGQLHALAAQAHANGCSGDDRFGKGSSGVLDVNRSIIKDDINPADPVLTKDGKFACELCKMVFSDGSYAAKHFKGQLHVMSVKSHASGEKEYDASNPLGCSYSIGVSSAAEMLSYLSDNPDELKADQLHCKLCKMVFSTKENASEHFNGKLHALTLETLIKEQEHVSDEKVDNAKEVDVTTADETSSPGDDETASIKQEDTASNEVDENTDISLSEEKTSPSNNTETDSTIEEDTASNIVHENTDDSPSEKNSSSPGDSKETESTTEEDTTSDDVDETKIKKETESTAEEDTTSNNDDETKIKKERKDPNRVFHCKVCFVFINSLPTAEQHFSGRKHAMFASQNEEEEHSDAPDIWRAKTSQRGMGFRGVPPLMQGRPVKPVTSGRPIRPLMSAGPGRPVGPGRPIGPGRPVGYPRFEEMGFGEQCYPMGRMPPPPWERCPLRGMDFRGNFQGSPRGFRGRANVAMPNYMPLMDKRFHSNPFPTRGGYNGYHSGRGRVR